MAPLFAFRKRLEELERDESMLVETSNRADAANAAAEQLPKSTKTKAFEGVVMYYGYRFYDPETGRWPSRDPIEEMGGLNLYGFCYNDSFGWFDDLGHEPKKQSEEKRKDASIANSNGKNANKTAGIANRANKSPKGGVTDAVEMVNKYGRGKIWIRERDLVLKSCYDKAKFIFTKGTGRVTKCAMCCQASLIVDSEGIAFQNGWELFYGTCEETEKERLHWLSQPKIHRIGVDFNFTEEYRYGDFN